MTGFQSKRLNSEFLRGYMEELFDENIYEFEFVQSGLSSAIDIYKYGGHMISKHKDRSYNILYDNRRCILEENSTINNTGLLDSRP